MALKLVIQTPFKKTYPLYIFKLIWYLFLFLASVRIFQNALCCLVLVILRQKDLKTTDVVHPMKQDLKAVQAYGLGTYRSLSPIKVYD